MISMKEYQTICKKFNLVPYLGEVLYEFPESNNFGSNVIVATFGSYGARICKYYDSAHKWIWLPWRAYSEEFEKDLIELCEIVKQMTIKKKKKKYIRTLVMDILDTIDEICKKYGLYKKSGLHENTLYYMIRPEFTHFVVKTYSNEQCGKLCYFVDYAYHEWGFLNDKNEYVSPNVYGLNLSDENWKKTLEFNIECIQENYKKLLFEKKLDAMNKDFE